MNDKAHIQGYAALTSVPYNVGPFTETIQKGAFKRTLQAGPDTQLLINHAGLPLARTTAGSLRLSEDDKGLRFEADVDPARSDVSDLLRAMSAGAIDQCSFGFIADQQEWSEDRKFRTLKQVSIHRGDVSIVNQAASPRTWATVAGAVSAMDVNSRRAAAEALGRNVRGSVEFTAHITERSPSPERRARGEGSFVMVELECRAPTTATLKSCARCQKAGKITLGGKRITCPNCGGRGASRVSIDGPHMGTSSDGSSRSRARQIDETRRLKALGIDVRKINIPAGGAGVTVGICRTCGGAGRLAKPGGGKARCDDCHGSGRVASGKLDPTGANAGLTVKDCPTCGGVGRILLPTGGKHRCDDCAGSGKIVSGKLDPTKTRTPSPVGGARTLAEFGIEQRSDYSQDELKAMWLKGAAYKDPDDGHFSFPTSTVAELLKAFSMVQLTGPEGKARESVRRYLIGRAKTMGQTDQVPDAWNSDGTLASSRSFHY